MRRRAEVLDDLWRTLASMGIEPLGDEGFDNSQWVLRKEVDPFGVASVHEDLDDAVNDAEQEAA